MDNMSEIKKWLDNKCWGSQSAPRHFFVKKLSIDTNSATIKVSNLNIGGLHNAQS